MSLLAIHEAWSSVKTRNLGWGLGVFSTCWANAREGQDIFRVNQEALLRSPRGRDSADLPSRWHSGRLLFDSSCASQAFVWQKDIVGVARYIQACTAALTDSAGGCGPSTQP